MGPDPILRGGRLFLAKQDFVEGNRNVTVESGGLGEVAGALEGIVEAGGLFSEAIDLFYGVGPDILDLDQEGSGFEWGELDVGPGPKAVVVGIKLDFQFGVGLDDLLGLDLFGEIDLDRNLLADKFAGVTDDGTENDAAFFQPDTVDRLAVAVCQPGKIGPDQAEQGKDPVFVVLGYIFYRRTDECLGFGHLVTGQNLFGMVGDEFVLFFGGVAIELVQGELDRLGLLIEVGGELVDLFDKAEEASVRGGA